MKFNAKVCFVSAVLFAGLAGVSRQVAYSDSGSAQRPYIGIMVADIATATQKKRGLKDRYGALVIGIAKDSPAARGGFRKDDIIRIINGKIIKSYKDVPKELGNKRVGSTVSIVVLRDVAARQTTSRHTLYLKVTEWPESDPRGCYELL